MDGIGDINEVAITGEAMPVVKKKGDIVYAGTLNETGSFLIKANTEPEDTMFSKIVQMVNAAQLRKAPLQKTVDHFTAWYLPIMLLAAVIGYGITQNMHIAVSILLVAAPCALAIGTPTAISAAMANMTKKGVLIKGGDSFEMASKVEVLMLDKTSTLTTGLPTINKIELFDAESEEIFLTYAATAEQGQSHPFARAIQLEAKKDIPLGGLYLEFFNVSLLI